MRWAEREIVGLLVHPQGQGFPSPGSLSRDADGQIVGVVEGIVVTPHGPLVLIGIPLDAPILCPIAEDGGVVDAPSRQV